MTETSQTTEKSRKTSFLLSLFYSQIWAMSSEAMDAIEAFLSEGLDIDPASMHRTNHVKMGGCGNDGESVLSYLGEGVASITCYGPIFPRSLGYAPPSSGVNTTEQLSASFKDAIADATVDKIALFIDSPGGVAQTIPDLASFIKSSPKPVYAFVEGYATSAAYYLASAASKIYSSPFGTTGSIGTIVHAERRDPSKGTRQRTFVSTQSPLKATDPFEAQGAEVIQKVIDEMTTLFIADVAGNRGKSPEYVAENFGRGGTMLSSEAFRVGAVDGIMTKEEFIASLKQRSHAGDPKQSSVENDDMTQANDEQFKAGYEAARAEFRLRLAASLPVLQGPYSTIAKQMATFCLNESLTPEALRTIQGSEDTQMEAAKLALAKAEQPKDLEVQSSEPVATPEQKETFKSSVENATFATLTEFDAERARLLARAGR